MCVYVEGGKGGKEREITYNASSGDAYSGECYQWEKPTRECPEILMSEGCERVRLNILLQRLVD